MLTWRSVKHGKAEASNTNMCSYYSKTVVFKLKKKEKSLLSQPQPTSTFQRSSSVRTPFNISY